MNLPARYIPTGKHFSGGQGVVTVWVDTWLQREVAVKVLHGRGIGGSLKDEAALLGGIKSKHVVELYDLGIDPISNDEYILMEFIDGTDLLSYTPSSASELYLTLFQIISGLDDIHKAHCIHRDIKPENIKRDGAGIIKIIDFGIGASQPVVNTGSGRGTDGYRGPEYYSTPIQLTSATDVYAFAVTAHKFCFGNLHSSLLTIPPTCPPSFSLCAFVPGGTIHPEIAQILDKCFDPTPAYRPCATEIKQVLAKHLLHGRHIGSFVYSGSIYVISNSSRGYKISTAKGIFHIQYDDLNFSIHIDSGQVYINGNPVSSGAILPGSCVITVGGGNGADRIFIPFNVSHPEVIL